MLFQSPVPFREALASREVRTVLPTDFLTELLDTISPELRERAMFSAGVMEAEKLQDMDDMIGQLLEGKMDRATARTEAKRFNGTLGQEVDESDLTDLASDARLNLILDTNVQQAQGYGSWAQGQDEAILDQWPAQELIRVQQAQQPRDWSQRWADAGGRFFGGRMIALKNDAIWTAISRFRLPYPPFDFGSGMDVQDIDRDEAQALGLIDRDTRIEPQTRPFAADLAATPDLRASGLKSALESAFAGKAAFDVDGVFRLLGGQTKNAANSYDPSQERDPADGKWTDGGGNPIGARPHDFLGKKPAEGEDSIPDDDNIARGQRAIEHLLNRKSGSVREALYLPGGETVEFAWGNTGIKAPNEHGVTGIDGGGVAHLDFKHAEDMRKVPEWIVKGVRSEPKFDSKHNVWKRVVEHKGNLVILTSAKPNSKRHWLVSGYDPDRGSRASHK